MPALHKKNLFVDQVVARLMPVGDARARAMFGGWGVYLDGTIMGIIVDERLYLKVDGDNRGDFAEAGMTPFTYVGANGPVAMSYWEIPPEVLAEPDRLAQWAAKAHAAARRARANKRPRAGRKTRPSV